MFPSPTISLGLRFERSLKQQFLSCFDLGKLRGLLRFLDFLLFKTLRALPGPGFCYPSSRGSIVVTFATPASAFRPSSPLRCFSLLSFIPLTERSLLPLLVASQARTSKCCQSRIGYAAI